MICAVESVICQQLPDTAAKIVTIANTELKDCVVSDNYIWILREDGILLKIQKDHYSVQDSLKLSEKIVAITEYAGDTMYIATEKGEVLKLSADLIYNSIWNTDQQIRFILFTSEKKCWLATDVGVYDPSNAKEYVPSKFAGHYGVATSGIGWDPSCTLVDSADNIWLGFNWGEWGGNVLKFSPEKKDFISYARNGKIMCILTPVHSIFEADNIIYSSSSLNHSSVRSVINKFHPLCTEFFISGGWRTNEIKNLYKGQPIYLGAAAYNNSDGCFYFCSEAGIFKCNRQQDFSKIENWQMIIPGRFGSEGSKIIFSDARAYFFHQKEGVIILDGVEMTFLKTKYVRWH